MKPAEAADTGRLRAFYEDPGTTVSSGSERGRRQAGMLATVLAQRTGAQQIVDVGCGDGSATHLVSNLNADNTVIGVDWSATALAGPAVCSSSRAESTPAGCRLLTAAPMSSS
jgi:trans-aconitate methyltransferase